MILISRYTSTVVLSTSLLLTACGGGSSDAPSPPPPANMAPVANAGNAQTVDELSSVTLDGSTSSDPDAGTSLTYSWSQTAGTTVTLSSTTSSQPTFDAPDVTAVNTPDTLTFQLTVSDGSLTASDNVDIVVNDIGVGVNSPPTASAGPDQTVAELTTTTLDGSASQDPDGDMLAFTWLQTAGPGVVLSDANAEQPSFTSPDVTAPIDLTFQLTVDDGADSTTDMVVITVQEALSAVTVSGVLLYEFVPTSHNNTSACFGLDFANIIERPIRAATVQLLDASNNILGQMVLGEDGSYSFANIPANTDVRVRVRAELKRSGSPNWDVEVRDNVDTSASPPPLATRPLYVTEWALNTGGNNITDADFTALTGWDGSAYTAARAAAPFAILDTIYTGMQWILSADASASFTPLDAFWSINNTNVSGTPTNIDLGEFGPSGFYSSGIDSLFLVGDAAVNTTEFDFAVVLHEWGHYFEDNFSRSDSVGGRHFLGELIEARTAFSEGWGHAVAAMASGDPMSCNTGAVGGGARGGFNLETTDLGPQGWYNELAIGGLILDLADTTNDGVDNNSIGFGPIFDVMTGPQVETEAFTTLFSFASLLRPNLTPSEQSLLDTLLATENIETTGLDIWGSTQANINIAPNNARDVMPLYTDYAADGSTLKICTNSDHDFDMDGNKPAEHRYLRVTTTSSAIYDVIVAANPVPPPTADTQPAPPADPIAINDRSDPDVFIYLNGGLVAFGNSGIDDVETFATQNLPADTYVVDLQEWRFGDPDQSSDFPDQVCFDVTMTAR
jgi:hypothetical protein